MKPIRKSNPEPITYTAKRDSLTITLRGKAIENLARIADAMNATSWCDTDNTPKNVFQNWVGPFIEAVAEDSAYYHNIPCGGISDVAEDVIDSIDTDEDEGTPADKRKRDELRQQMVARGLLK